MGILDHANGVGGWESQPQIWAPLFSMLSQNKSNNSPQVSRTSSRKYTTSSFGVHCAPCLSMFLFCHSSAGTRSLNTASCSHPQYCTQLLLNPAGFLAFAGSGGESKLDLRPHPAMTGIRYMISSMSAESLTQRWLRQNVSSYPSKDHVFVDIDAALARFTTLHPKSDVYS